MRQVLRDVMEICGISEDKIDTLYVSIDNEHLRNHGAGSVLVGSAAFKADVRGEKSLGCVRFAHGSAKRF